MRGNAKVQENINKKTNQRKCWILIPSALVKALDIKKGNRIDFDMENPNPDYVDPIKIGNNFKKLKEEV